MTTLSQETFPNVWRALGLSVAAGYLGLGSICFIQPLKTAESHGLMSTGPDADKIATRAMAWIGARDISIAAALFTFYYQEKPREMGTVILSGMFLCIVDSVFVFRHRQDLYAYFITVGAAMWGWIGYNLIQL